MNDDRILIVGVGHNGLVCTFYLASAGLKVKVVERRDVVGAPSARKNSIPASAIRFAAYTVSQLNPKVIDDMNLSVHGLTMVERRASNFLPQPDGRYLMTGPGRAHRRRYFRRRLVAGPALLGPAPAELPRFSHPPQGPL